MDFYHVLDILVSRTAATSALWLHRLGRNVEEGLVKKMLPQETVTAQILTALRKVPDAELDALASSLPGLTWNQVFLEVDRLSRIGKVRVSSALPGTYTIKFSPDN